MKNSNKTPKGIRQINSMQPSRIRVNLKDMGQDLLWIEVDLKTEQITDCGPFHKHIYYDKYVFCPSSIQVGGYLDYSPIPIVEYNQPLTQIKYKVTSIQPLA